MNADFTPAPGISGSLLLEAIAHVETNGGRANWPRLEAGYIPKGLAITAQGRVISGTGACVNQVVRQRWQRWAPDSWGTAASWGPWQILYHTAADLGFAGAPWELWTDAASRPWVMKRLEVIGRQGAATVEQFADAWNSGDFRDDRVPAVYIRSVAAAYKALSVPRPALGSGDVAGTQGRAT